MALLFGNLGFVAKGTSYWRWMTWGDEEFAGGLSCTAMPSNIGSLDVSPVQTEVMQIVLSGTSTRARMRYWVLVKNVGGTDVSNHALHGALL